MPAPSMLDLDVLRASLGPSIVPPYEHAYGAVPWLTAGTLTWHGGDAAMVLPMWRAWSRRLPGSVVTAVRRTDYVVAVDVAVIGDPWGAAGQLAPLRSLDPIGDTVGLVAPSALHRPGRDDTRRRDRRGGAQGHAPRHARARRRAAPRGHRARRALRRDGRPGAARGRDRVRVRPARHVALAALDRRLGARAVVE